MKLIEAIILGIVQGATEFLPVSSSGHLVLVSWWLDIDNPPLMFSVMVHLGTTAAVLIYFREDWSKLMRAFFDALVTRRVNFEESPELRLIRLLILGSIPAFIAGFLLDDYFEDTFSKPGIVSFMLLVTAFLLIYGERAASSSSPSTTTEETQPEDMTITDALIIGFAQALAIMPGISRSGSTIAAGLYRGLQHSAATRYSFLLATPVILGAGLKQLVFDVIVGDATIDNDMFMALLVGFVAAALVGYASIALLLQIVRRHSLYGFAYYCVVFGLLSLGASWLSG